MAKTTSTNPAIFSDDITIEIFSRLPVKSLMRFRCLSRYFNSLVSESFMVDFHQRNFMSTRPDEIKLFVQESEGFCSIEMKKDGKVSRCNFDFLYDHLSYSSGLFCFWVEKLESVRIFNPGTREVILLPRVKQLYPVRNLRESYLSSYYGCSYLLGYEPEGKIYKVLMTLCVSRNWTRNWIFTLGTDKHWREIDHFNNFPYKRGICISGVIYIWDCSGTFIAEFNLKSEKFKIIPLWAPHHWTHDYELMEVNGKLAVRDYSSSKNVHLQILADTQKNEWQRHVICFPSHLKNIGDYKICSSCDGEILILLIRFNGSVNIRSCYCYDVRKKSWKYLKTSLSSVKCRINEGFYTYVESLFPLEKICNARYQS